VIEALGLPLHRRAPVGYDLVGLLGGVFFVILALRELALTTRVDFRVGELVIRAPLAPWVRFAAPMSEIEGFGVVSKEDGTHQVVAHIRAELDRILPLGFETVPTRASGTRKRPFASPVAYASFLAGRLGEMLETARRSGHDTYRT
jgi:hypothetical protein